MKMKFIAKGEPQPRLVLNDEVVNGLGFSNFPEGAKLSVSALVDSAGIYNAERIDGVLHIVVGQCGLAYNCQPVNGSHDWHGTGEWIDVADYDPNRCYIVATSAPEEVEYVKRENGWTVMLLQIEEEPTQ